MSRKCEVIQHASKYRYNKIFPSHSFQPLLLLLNTNCQITIKLAAPPLLSAFLGVLIGLSAFLSLAINFAIMLVLVVRTKLIRANPIYALSALNLFSDCLQNAGILLFLAPTSFAQDFLLEDAHPNRPIWLFFMLLFQVQYYSSLFILIAVAVNRLIAVAFPARAYLINHEAVYWTAAAIFPLSIALTILADFVLPCCRTNYSFTVYSYQFFSWRSANESMVNYKNWAMDLPLNVGTTAILLFCYGAIFLKVIQSNRKDVVRSNVALSQNRRRSELRYAVQFALISVFYIASWVSFRLFPMFVPKDVPELYSLTTFFEIGNCSANALIYLTMNQEMKQHFVRSVRRMLGLSVQSSSVEMGATQAAEMPPHFCQRNGSAAAVAQLHCQQQFKQQKQQSQQQQQQRQSTVVPFKMPTMTGNGGHGQQQQQKWANRVAPTTKTTTEGA